MASPNGTRIIERHNDKSGAAQCQSHTWPFAASWLSLTAAVRLHFLKVRRIGRKTEAEKFATLMRFWTSASSKKSATLWIVHILSWKRSTRGILTSSLANSMHGPGLQQGAMPQSIYTKGRKAQCLVLMINGGTVPISSINRNVITAELTIAIVARIT